MLLTVVVVLFRLIETCWFFKSILFMNTGDGVLMLSIYELPLLFKPSKEGDAAICHYCKGEVL